MPYLLACPHGGVAAAQRSGDTDESEARGLVQQVEERDYNPPRRERILEWQSQQKKSALS
jgi:hypothetical protein